MFARNLLQAGEFVTLVPVGIPVTLQYSDKGSIQKIYLNHEKTDHKDVTETMLPVIIKNKQVPNKVSVKGGTTWVRGVFYTENIYSGTGDLPDCIMGDLLEAFYASPRMFAFFAGDVMSLALKFKGAVATRQWLSVSGFDTLQGYVVPADITEEKFESMVEKNYLFKYPLISSYILYHKDGTISYPKTGLRQFIVNRVARNVSEDGNIFADVTATTGETYRVLYPYVVKFNLHQNTLVVMKDNNDFIFSAQTSSSRKDTRSSKLQCSFCGKNLNVPNIEVREFKCSDENCTSRLYPRVNQLLSTLELPTLSYSSYLKTIKDYGTGFSVVSVLDTDMYKDCKVEITLETAIRAFVPKYILPGAAQISQFCDACNNTIESVVYYVQNVDKMKVDLDLDFHAFNRFYIWLLSDNNALNLVEFIKRFEGHYIRKGKHFDGAPIFRDKLIYLTGTFEHGSLAEVRSILESYSASVATDYSNLVDLVLLGSIPENVNGSAVVSARKHGKPVMQEAAFFDQYDIDSDLSENL